MISDNDPRIVTLVAVSSAWRRAQLAAQKLGDVELADRCRDEGVRALKLLGEVKTGRRSLAS